ncbi:MAG TPA: anti-sigma factor [Streptosporangiaceae bacterium]
MRLLRHELHILTGAYALDAVDGRERDRFERHLHRCQPCGQEVLGLRETATRLAVAVARVPPPRLRERVLTAAAATRQLPPLTDLSPASRPSRRWVPRLAAGLAAAAVAVAIVLGVVLAGRQHQLDAAQARQQAIAEVLNSPGAKIASRPTSLGGSVTVVISRQLGKVVYTTAGLPPLPRSKVYQLWLLGPPRTRSAGLLPLPVAGRTVPLLAAGLASGDSFGVTVEPAGGTAQPTTAPIVDIPLLP